jgi:hypothetical protein
MDRKLTHDTNIDLSNPTSTAASTNEIPSSIPATASSAEIVQDVPDPAEIDISEHYYQPSTAPRAQSSYNAAIPRNPGLGEQPLMSPEAMQQLFFPGGSPLPVPGSGPEGPEDLMKMLQTLMEASGAGIPGMLPPDPSQQAASQAQKSMADSAVRLWRLLHTVTIALVSILILSTPFDGSRHARLSASSSHTTHLFPHIPVLTTHPLFYIFISLEIALLSGRFLLERGRLPPDSMLSTIANFAPEPFKGYLGIAARYIVIIKSVVADALTLIFVLGAVSWWKHGIPS